ncbi:MAG: hypothetical protein ABFQ95_01465 [Pseudomonadota bacterium]
MQNITIKSYLFFASALLGGLLIVGDAAQSIGPAAIVGGEVAEKVIGSETTKGAPKDIPGFGKMKEFIPEKQMKKLEGKGLTIENLEKMGTGEKPSLEGFVPEKYKGKLEQKGIPTEGIKKMGAGEKPSLEGFVPEKYKGKLEQKGIPTEGIKKMGAGEKPTIKELIPEAQKGKLEKKGIPTAPVEELLPF